MTKVYLSLGSNIGNKNNYLDKAKNQLKAQGIQITKESQLYESEPWGETNQDWFLNQCIEIETDLNPTELYTIIEQIEQNLDKEKITKFGPRTIDIDILLYDSSRSEFTINHSQLIIPHERLTKRQFVLIPLNEIAPNLVHPIDKKTIKELQSECEDKSTVRVWIQSNSES